MISRRYFLKGLTLTVAGLLVPEVVGKVFYSIPKIVVPQNLDHLYIHFLEPFKSLSWHPRKGWEDRSEGIMKHWDGEKWRKV
ncbi:hypothetical protein LCGC14_0890020 [marine sediment metagenome]|uniref:Uncharacterized protein n=1 Tax=marine sediment metagenome TaxID=412755 RepID=A0A0F9PKB2_9ZZZZ